MIEFFSIVFQLQLLVSTDHMRLTDMARKSTNEVDFLASEVDFLASEVDFLASEVDFLAKRGRLSSQKILARKSTSLVDFLAMSVIRI